MTQIRHYIAEASGSPERAIAYVRRIREWCEHLKTFPQAGRARDDLRPGVRIIAFERRVAIAYVILPSGDVEIGRFSMVAVTMRPSSAAKATRNDHRDRRNLYGGEAAGFTSFRAGAGFLNLIAQPADKQWSWWGRAIFYESDVDGLYERLVAAGYPPSAPPRDAEWGERFFHVTDPDGHEISFARPLRRGSPLPATVGQT